MNTKTNMGPTVAFIRHVTGMTQAEFASAHGVGRQCIADMERGKVRVSWETLEKFIGSVDRGGPELAVLVAQAFARGMGLECLGARVIVSAEEELERRALAAVRLRWPSPTGGEITP